MKRSSKHFNSSQSHQNYKRQSVQKYVHLYKVKSIHITFRIES